MKTTIAYRAFKAIDQDTQTMLRDGARVPDHRASAQANLDKASDALGAIGQMWGDVFSGRPVLGGTRPEAHVAAASGNLDKARAALVAHGGNGALAALTSLTGAIGASVDASHAAVHGLLGAFRGKSE